METTLIFAFILTFVSTLGLGVSVFFFGKAANREACGSVPHVKPNEDCPSQKAGLCPFEDKTGVVKMAKRAQITYVRKDLAA